MTNEAIQHQPTAHEAGEMSDEEIDARIEADQWKDDFLETQPRRVRMRAEKLHKAMADVFYAEMHNIHNPCGDADIPPFTGECTVESISEAITPLIDADDRESIRLCE